MRARPGQENFLAWGFQFIYEFSPFGVDPPKRLPLRDLARSYLSLLSSEA
jgi:hypothetical protein